MADADEIPYETIFNTVREESHRILTESDTHLREHLLSGRIHAGVDRAFARQFLSDKRTDQLGEAFGISLVASRRILNLIILLEHLIVFVIIILSVWSFGRWGLFSIIMLPILVMLSWRSAPLPRLKGGLPKVLMMLFLGYATFAPRIRGQ